MARRVKSKDLETRAARAKLKPSGKPYWQAIGLGLHVGYRKGKRSGMWVVRRYLGDQNYKVETVAIADDTEDANGDTVLDFWQAQQYARTLRTATSVSEYTVGDAIRDYVTEHLAGRSSAYDVRVRLHAHALPYFAKVPVVDLKVDDLPRWHRNLANRGPRVRTARGAPQAYKNDAGTPDATRRRRASANRVLSYLKSALTYALSTNKVDCAPVWNRAKPFKGTDVPRSRYLTLDECKRLVEAADPEFRVLVRAALQTGARYSELARLRVEDFDPRAGTLHIKKSKSGKDRHIILTDEGRVFFANLAQGRERSDLLLGREWRTSAQVLPMARACIQAGIQGATFHTLRHTWASHSVMNGMPLVVVAKNLGHVDARMVERVYGHLGQSYVTDALRSHAPRFGI